MAMIEMTVEGIGIDPSNNPLVLLRDQERKMFVPIWIGPAEAVSIQMELDSKTPQRPMTHDLITNILQELGAKLIRVTVNDFADSVYYASLHLEMGRGENGLQEIDARPSDAIALALRTNAQILVADDVAAKTGIAVSEEPVALPEPSESDSVTPKDEDIDRLSRLLEGIDLDQNR
jgi:bifunctional DNase/RNase